jgi:peptide/nickel transport system permease protein
VAGLAIVAVMVAIAAAGPPLMSHGEAQIVGGPFDAPSAGLPLGTDVLGRDVLTRMVYGARNSISLAATVALLSFSVGTVTGLLAATSGGVIDFVLSRLVDLMLAIPQKIFALLLLAILGTSLPVLIVVIATLDAPRVFRVARSVALDIVALEFVEAARLRGDTRLSIMVREVLPNALPTLITEFGLRFCFVFLFISALSFLGLGLQPPTADWGSMVRENAALIGFGDITPLYPAFAIALLAIGVNLVTEWLAQHWSHLQDD